MNLPEYREKARLQAQRLATVYVNTYCMMNPLEGNHEPGKQVPDECVYCSRPLRGVARPTSTTPTSKQKWTYDDGGRKAAGYKGDAGDCVTRSIAIAANVPYQKVYDDLKEMAEDERVTKRQKKKSSVRDGVRRTTIQRYMTRIGWKWHPTMHIGSGCKVHLRADELPPGRIIVSLSKHLAAVIDGVIHDTHDPSREGTRCVYGYWTAAGH